MDHVFPSLPSDRSASVLFTSDDVVLPDFNHEVYLQWLIECASSKGFLISSLTYVLVSDDTLYQMNVEQLQHDTYTDIITFDLRDDVSSSIIDGECYVSIDRIKENSIVYGVSLFHELRRVFVHGLLHLCGLGDKSVEDAAQMREAENDCLAVFSR